jgi:hypothetical protein
MNIKNMRNSQLGVVLLNWFLMVYHPVAEAQAALRPIIYMMFAFTKRMTAKVYVFVYYVCVFGVIVVLFEKTPLIS